MIVDKYRTECCNAKVYRKGRADYRCKTCDKDYSLHIVFLMEADMKEREAFKSAGYAGMLPEGMIVDRREHPEAIPVQENSMLGFAKPKKLDNE